MIKVFPHRWNFFYIKGLVSFHEKMVPGVVSFERSHEKIVPHRCMQFAH